MRPGVRTLLVALLLAGSMPAAAQQWPNRAVRLVVPYPPGGSADILARAFGQKLTELGGQPWIIENRAGAGTAIGTLAVAQSAPDGQTFLMGTVSSHAINPTLNRKIGYDPVRDFTPVAPLASIPFALLVHPALPVRNLGELIALARSKPGTLTYSSAGSGTSNHLAGALLDVTAGIQTVHVPYKGSAPALADLLSGQVNMMFDLVLTASPQVRSGTVRALAVSGHERSANLPGVPTFAEAGLPGYEVSAWFGVFGPAGLPPAIVARLAELIAQARSAPDVRERLASQGADPMSGSPTDFARLVRSELDRWGRVVQAAGMQVD
jgi:tripartite-type tricarboxylate transporter receptor subunit TctC